MRYSRGVPSWRQASSVLELTRPVPGCHCKRPRPSFWNGESDWSMKMSRIGLEAECRTAQAEMILTGIAGLFQELDGHREFQKRIHGIDRDAELFKQEVAASPRELPRISRSHSAAEQARELANRLRNAQADARQFKTLFQQREREQANLRSAEVEHEEPG